MACLSCLRTAVQDRLRARGPRYLVPSGEQLTQMNEEASRALRNQYGEDDVLPVPVVSGRGRARVCALCDVVFCPKEER